MSELAQLQELVPFLRDQNPQVRQIALKNLVGHTLKSSPYRSTLFFPTGLAASVAQGADSRSPIWSLKQLCRDQTMIAHDAFSALVNLSDSAMAQKELGDDDFLVFLTAYIINPTSVLSSLASMLLSNITAALPVTKSLSTILLPFLPLVPNLKISPPHLQTYYLPSCRSASSLPPPNMPLPTEEVTLEYVPALSLLVEAFVQGAGVGEVKETDDEGKKVEGGLRKGDVNFLATVFSNLSILPPIRQALLAPSIDLPVHPLAEPASVPSVLQNESLLGKLLIFTEHKDVIRRGGVLSTLKHIALSTQTHPILLASEDESVSVPQLADNKSAMAIAAEPFTPVSARGVDVLPKILGPLMGGEEVDIDEMDALPSSLQFLPPDKQRERDVVLRLTCVEILLLLATTLAGRVQLRARGVYTVIKFAHKAETDEKTADSMYRLVNLLQRDEGPETKLAAEEAAGEIVTAEAEEELESDDEIIEV